MTYKELYDKASNLLEHSKITLGEWERMIEPLNQTIERPLGKWMPYYEKSPMARGVYIGTTWRQSGWSCSECSEVVDRLYPNCPFCLARMDGAMNGGDALDILNQMKRKKREESGVLQGR